MIRLFVLTMVVLLLPKLMGLARALARADLRRGCGGAARLFASFFAELAISALLAPIMMVIHSRQIYEILAGRDAGWSAQRRDDGETRWSDAWRHHRWHMACGLATIVAAWFLSPAILAWMSPTLAGLLLAVPLSRASGSARVGAALRRLGLLATPEETNPDPLFKAREEAALRTPPLPRNGVEALVLDDAVRATHFKWASSAPRRRGAPDSAYLTAAEKVSEARTLQEALSWLEPRERVHVAGHQAIAEQLVRLTRGDDPGTGAAQPKPPRLVDLPAEQVQMRHPAA